MPKITFICKNCGKEDSCDIENNKGEAFRSTGQMVIIERCHHCGHSNRIVIPSSEG